MAIYNDVKKIKIGNDIFNLYDSGGTVTSIGITDGEGLTSSGGPITSSGNITLSLDAATSSTLGGIKVGYGASGKNYAIALDSSNNAYVNVPWTDTNTKVNQYYTTTSSAYPLLFSYTAGISSTSNRGAQYARLVNSIYAVPSTGTIYTDSFRSLNTIAAERGVFNKLIATSASIGDLDVNNLTAQNATVVGLLDVKGELHTNQWTNANIANIGGSFYISPTIEDFDDGSPLISISYDSSSAAPLEMAISGKFATDFVKSGQSATGVNWPADSLILVTGDIEVNGMTYPLGTLKGTLKSPVTATNQQTSKTITLDNLKDAQNNSNPSVLQELYEANNHSSISNATFKNGKISLYEIEGYRIGILLSSMGDDSNSIIDIYGGVSSEPNVRIGHLGTIPSWTDDAGITHTPKGWGIYTNNGYFTGTVIANAGVIGGWVTSSSALYKGAFASNGSIWLTPNGYDSSIGIGGAPPTLHSWAATASNKFGVTTSGDLFASSATISGNITATSGTIGDCQIENGVLKVNTITGGTAGTSNYIYVSTVDSSRTINEIEKDDWRLILGNTFAVNKEGYITASTGKIGGWKTNATSFSVDKTFDDVEQGSATISDYIILSNDELLTAKQILERKSTDWNMAISNTFGITSGGSLYTANSNILEGTLGLFNFTKYQFYSTGDKNFQAEIIYPTYTKNGLTFTRVGHTLKVYGTATADTDLHILGPNFTYTIKPADAGGDVSWRFGGCYKPDPDNPSDFPAGSNSTYKVIVRLTKDGVEQTSGSGTVYYDYGDGVEVSEKYRYARMTITIYANMNCGTAEAPLTFNLYLYDENGKNYFIEPTFINFTNNSLEFGEEKEIEFFTRFIKEQSDKRIYKSFGHIGLINASNDKENYLNYYLEQDTNNEVIGRIDLKAAKVDSDSGVFTNLVTNSFIAESIGLNGEDLSTRLTNLGTGITAVQANVTSLTANLATNYYTKTEVDNIQTNLNSTLDQNIGAINQLINQINTTLSTMNDTFGVNTEFYFAKNSIKKWRMRLGKEVVSGQPNLNDVWVR